VRTGGMPSRRFPLVANATPVPAHEAQVSVLPSRLATSQRAGSVDNREGLHVRHLKRSHNGQVPLYSGDPFQREVTA
jgi:hypothetical protein